MANIPFLITIDVEGDNAWATPEVMETKNARFIPRFQELCEKYALKPTYLTNYEMARDPFYQEFAKDVHSRGEGEIGMHLHAWDTPPLEPISDRDWYFQPYIIEYSRELIFAKVETMTKLIEDTFGVHPISHRAGRWAWDDTLHEALLTHGYRVDCSLTPYWDWGKGRFQPGSKIDGLRHFDTPAHAHRMELKGKTGLLQVPFVSLPVKGIGSGLRRGLPFKPPLVQRLIDRFCVSPSLRPCVNSLDQMKLVLAEARSTGRDYVEFMIHSSEFMPGGSPYYPTEQAVDALFDDLEGLFADARNGFVGMTLNQFCAAFESKERETK